MDKAARKIYRKNYYQKTKAKHKEQMADWYQKNKDAVKKHHIEYENNHKKESRNRQLKRIYGLTLIQYDQMLEEQNYLCAICGRCQDEFKRSFAVDHDHVTGKIRGLLCENCNTMIGHAFDNTLILENAILYLKI